MRAWLILGMMFAAAVGQSPTITLPKLDPSRRVWLGTAHTLYAGGRVSYARRQTIKPKNRIRIGIFGPSIATTSEVGQNEDIPTHLQELLRSAGHTNVEVLGFGLGSAPLQYSYLLWHTIGRRMGLDHVVVVLPQIHVERETHFLGNSGMHGRFVLNGNGLKAIRPQGDTPEEAAAIYKSLIPHWNYYRYDTRVPPLVQKFFPGVEKNPFYYQADPKKESEEVVARLLERWKREARRLSVYFPRQAMPEIEARLDKAKIPFLRSQLEPLPELYRSSAVHLSSLGNQARARELFHYLMGEKTFSVALIKGELRRVSGKAQPWPPAEKRWYVFGAFGTLATLEPPKPLPRPAPKALVALDPYSYVELEASLKNDLPAALVVALPGQRLRFPIGHIRRENDYIGTFVPLAKTEISLPIGTLKWKEGFRFLAKEKYSKAWVTLGEKAFPLVNQLTRGKPFWSPSPLAWNFHGKAIPFSLPSKGPFHLVVRIGKIDISLPLQISFDPRHLTIPTPYPWPLLRSLASSP